VEPVLDRFSLKCYNALAHAGAFFFSAVNLFAHGVDSRVIYP